LACRGWLYHFEKRKLKDKEKEYDSLWKRKIVEGQVSIMRPLKDLLEMWF
jgi:hypothetical protein